MNTSPIPILAARCAVLLALLSLPLPGLADEAAYRAQVQGLTPHGFWSFDEPMGGSAQDSSGAGLHGFYNGAREYSHPGAFGGTSRSVRFLGGHMVVPSTPAFLSTTGITVTGWIKAQEGSALRMIVNKEGSYEMALVNGQLQGAVETAGVGGWFWSGNAPVNLHQWHHVALTYSSTSGLMTLYLNGGAAVFSQPLNGPVEHPSPGVGLYFGTRGGAVGDAAFIGWLDEMAYFPRALTGTEITSLYQAALFGVATPPQSQVVIAGTPASFSVTASGTAPFAYQWRFNGEAIPGATSATLGFTAASAHAGNYDVLITNAHGSLTSSVATLTVYAPPPALTWQRQDGGTGGETARAIIRTSDGGFLVGGVSATGGGGNKTSTGFGGMDYWVVRLDSAGTKLWERVHGGATDDQLYALVETTDGGCLLAGESASPMGTGNKTAPFRGSTDYWVVKLDVFGNKQWDASYGGADADTLVSVARATDGTYFLAGYSGFSSGGTGTKGSASFGHYDYWVVRIDGNGNQTRESTHGGTGADYLGGVTATSDNGCLLGGGSDSPVSGNKTSPTFGANDGWVVKLNSNLDKQ